MRVLLILLLCICSYFSNAQTCYSGFIGKSAIQLVTYLYGDGDVRAIYAYEKYDTPLRINGRKAGQKLELYERNDKEEIVATLRIDNFDESKKTLSGVWISKDLTKQFPISLERTFALDDTKEVKWNQREIIQSTSTADHYFKLLICKQEDDFSARVCGVKVLEKKTDRLLQTISLDCQLMGLDNISIGDFNFDGLQDFSVFESSYAGPNTSSIYILRVPKSEQYIVSDFSGTCLEFDESSKTIHEHNQCCAGRSHMNATYKVVNNKMVLLEQTCLEYDEKTEDFIEKKCN